jgi:hypothetical protein
MFDFEDKDSPKDPYGIGRWEFVLLDSALFLVFGPICIVLLGDVIGEVTAMVCVLAFLAAIDYAIRKWIRRLRVRKTTQKEMVRCSFCKDPVETVNAVICPACNSPYHIECFESNEGCATFACVGAKAKLNHSKEAAKQQNIG